MKAHWGKSYSFWLDDINATESSLLTILMRMRNEHTELAFPKIQDLVEETRSSRPTVFRSLHKLRTLGWIERCLVNGVLQWHVHPPMTVAEAEQIRAQKDGDV